LLLSLPMVGGKWVMRSQGSKSTYTYVSYMIGRAKGPIKTVIAHGTGKNPPWLDRRAFRDQHGAPRHFLLNTVLY
jgi:hypothetical protein